MATQTSDYGNEKQETSFIENAQESPTGTSLNLEKERTLEGIDIHNRQAFKGDDSDGKVTWTWKSIIAAMSLAGLYTGSQLILYFTGASVSFMSEDFGITQAQAWLPTSNILAIAAACPFAGYLQDLFGKRYIALFGSFSIILGSILVGTAHTFGQGLAGMVLSGVGAAIGELTGLAGLAEIVPVRFRGYSLAVLTAFVLPFCPYLLYVELWAHRDATVGWRWGPWCTLIYNGLVGLGLLFCYHPHNHTRAEGFSRKAIVKRMDFIGGGLSITGLTLFLVALNSGGYTHAWTSAYTLCTLLIGLLLIACWIVYEWKFAKYPMVPGEIFKGQRIVGLAYFVAFTAGMNFFSILNFFPTLFSTVYEPDPVKIGVRGLAPSFSTAIGAIVGNAALSWFPSHSREVLLVATLLMATFIGSLAVCTPENEGLTIAFGSLASFGVGGVLVPAATIAMIVCPDALITTAAALSLSIRTVGGSIGYSIYYNVFVTKLTKNLPKYVAEYAIKAGLPLTSAETFVGLFLTNPTALATTEIEGMTPQVMAGAAKGSMWAYSQSLKYVWLTSIAFGGLAVICTILLPSTKKYQTNRVAVHL